LRIFAPAHIVSDDAVSPKRLGEIERAIAIAQKIFRRIPVIWKHRDSDR